MKFKELGYILPGKFLQIAGTGYFLYGLLKNDREAISMGINTGIIGTLLDIRSSYVHDKIKKLENKISELERRV